MLLLTPGNARCFLDALEDGSRVDGRNLLEGRHLVFQFPGANGCAEASLGRTRVFAQVAATIVPLLRSDASSEGKVVFSARLCPTTYISMIKSISIQPAAAGAAIAASRSGGREGQLQELIGDIEHTLRQTLNPTVLDREALCIQVGRWAWKLSIQVTVLQTDGNLLDASALAALAAVQVFRKPAVDLSKIGDETNQLQSGILKGVTEQEPLPLCLHHLPISVSFAYAITSRPEESGFPSSSSGTLAGEEEDEDSYSAQTLNAGDDECGGAIVVLDPTGTEECALPGKVSVLVDEGGHLFGIEKIGRSFLKLEKIEEIIMVAKKRALELQAILQASVKSYEERQLRLLRANMNTRYDSPCVELKLPAPHTKVIPKTIKPIFPIPLASMSSLHQPHMQREAPKFTVLEQQQKTGTPQAEMVKTPTPKELNNPKLSVGESSANTIVAPSKLDSCHIGEDTGSDDDLDFAGAATSRLKKKKAKLQKT